MTVDNTVSEKRKVERHALDSIQLPFLGSLDSSNELFQYLIVDVSTQGAKIVLPAWLLSRANINPGDVVNFHLPMIIQEITHIQGQVMWTQWDERLNGQACGLQFYGDLSLKMPIYLSVSESGSKIEGAEGEALKDLLLKAFKDAVILKTGISIYLRHLIPYFSRFSGYSYEEFPVLKEVVFDDIEKNIIQNQEKLQKMQADVIANFNTPSDIPSLIDLEEIRGAVESEINQEIFNTAFETKVHIPYFKAIKALEKTLYNHYNTIVLIYTKSMG